MDQKENRRNERGLVIGLTGGIACGKSTAAAMLAARGWAELDADRVVHRLLEPGRTAHRKVLAQFGSSVIREDGTIDRGRLGQRVFADESERRQLNACLHPPVHRYTACWIRAQRRAGHRACVTVPLLFEADFRLDWDTVVCIAAPGTIAEERLRKRGLTKVQAVERIASQWPIEQKCRLADMTIWNTGTRGELEQKIDQLINDLTTRSI